jgi:hypothetical protein
MNPADNSENVENTDDLNEFEDLFYNREAQEAEEVVNEEEDPEVEGHDEDDALATDEDENLESDDEEEEDEEPQPKQKKNKVPFKERINEMTAKIRETERQNAALLKQIEEMKSGTEEKTDEKPPLRDVLPDGAPDPDAVDDKGEPLFPLGEFDPKYITALTRFTIEQETTKAKEAAQREEQERAIREVQQELSDSWNTRLDAAEEEMPEIRNNISRLTEAFEGINPAYGEYLAMTIMSSDVGHLVMNYLSDNIGEAQKIVASGPAAATLALGRLEAQFIKNTTKEEKRNKKVSDAPEPPESRTRGHGGRFSVNPDTDDLDAFEREFYKK